MTTGPHNHDRNAEVLPPARAGTRCTSWGGAILADFTSHPWTQTVETQAPARRPVLAVSGASGSGSSCMSWAA